MFKKVSAYKKTVKSATQKAVDNLQEMFKKQWEQNNEVLQENNENKDL